MMPHVFVYGTLRCGGRNDIARYRPEPRFIGEASIAGTLFDLGAYPGVVLGGAQRVKGEVYAIEPAVETGSCRGRTRGIPASACAWSSVVRRASA